MPSVAAPLPRSSSRPHWLFGLPRRIDMRRPLLGRLVPTRRREAHQILQRLSHGLLALPLAADRVEIDFLEFAVNLFEQPALPHRLALLRWIDVPAIRAARRG